MIAFWQRKLQERKMKSCNFLLGLALFALGNSVAFAQDKLTLQLKWVTQAQFAGYYVA